MDQPEFDPPDFNALVPVPRAERPPPRTIAQLARAGLIIEDEGRTRLGDEFRIAATRLHSTIKASINAGLRCGNTLLITSTKPAEGKSFSSLNLAAALAQTATRPVILVDADNKPGCLSDLVGLKRYSGVFDMVADESLDPAELVVETPVRGLSLIPIGNPAAATNLQARPRPLTEVADILSLSLSDCTLVIDTGPLLATADPSVLAPAMAQIVMIVEAEKTRRPELEAALDLIRGCPKVLLMLNKVAGRQRSTFGAYSYYGDYYAKPNAPPPAITAPVEE
jgi:receptor protein-tyrosine kinase